MITTDDDALAKQIRLLKNQGMTKEHRYWHPVVGYNYRLTNLQAAIGVAQLERLAELLARHREVASWYQEELAGVRGLWWQQQKEWARHLCGKAGRVLRKDFTVAYHKKLYQIEDQIRAGQVQVQERPDGSIAILSKGRSLKYREILTRPVKEKKQPVRVGPKKTTIPPKDHYWRNFKFGKGRYAPGISPQPQL